MAGYHLLDWHGQPFECCDKLRQVQSPITVPVYRSHHRAKDLQARSHPSSTAGTYKRIRTHRSCACTRTLPRMLTRHAQLETRRTNLGAASQCAPHPAQHLRIRPPLATSTGARGARRRGWPRSPATSEYSPSVDIVPAHAPLGRRRGHDLALAALARHRRLNTGNESAAAHHEIENPPPSPHKTLPTPSDPWTLLASSPPISVPRTFPLAACAGKPRTIARASVCAVAPSTRTSARVRLPPRASPPTHGAPHPARPHGAPAWRGCACKRPRPQLPMRGGKRTVERVGSSVGDSVGGTGFAVWQADSRPTGSCAAIGGIRAREASAGPRRSLRRISPSVPLTVNETPRSGVVGGCG
jgi:hypothetical protein